VHFRSIAGAEKLKAGRLRMYAGIVPATFRKHHKTHWRRGSPGSDSFKFPLAPQRSGRTFMGMKNDPPGYFF
jgi:hypothetical protein